MAERLDSFDFTGGRPGGSSKYDEYLDGGIYRLVRGEDFDVQPISVRARLYALAKKRGLKIHSAMEPDALVIQAYKPEEAE